MKKDLIDREALINALKTDCSWDIFDEHGNYTARGLGIIEVISSLPSAEKTQLSGEDATKDATSELINRQKAIKALYDYWSGCSFDGDGYDIADKSEDVLNDLPSAEPERIVCAEVKLSKEEIQEAVDDAVKKMMAEMAEPEPRKRGKWEVYESSYGLLWRCTCDQCRHTTHGKQWVNPNYCPNCGCRMGGEDDEVD